MAGLGSAVQLRAHHGGVGLFVNFQNAVFDLLVGRIFQHIGQGSEGVLPFVADLDRVSAGVFFLMI